MINEKAAVFVPNIDNPLRDVKKLTQALNVKVLNIEQQLNRMDF